MNVPGLKIVAPGTPADAKGLMTAAIRDPDPVHLPRAQVPLPPAQGGRARGRPRGADRQGPRGPRRQATSRSSPTRPCCTSRWRRRRPRPRTGSTSRWSTCARCCRSTRRRSWRPRRRPGKVIVLHEADAHRRPGRRGRGAHRRARLRVPRRAGRAGGAARHAGALLAAARGGLPAQRRQGRPGHPGAGYDY